MTYGYEAKGKKDRKLVVPKLLTQFSGKYVQKNTWILNGFPFRMWSSLTSSNTKLNITILVRHIPAWVPYFSFRPVAEIGRAISQEMLYPPIRFVKESIVSIGPSTIVISRIVIA